MKRKNTAKFVVLAGAATFALSGCMEESQVSFFDDVAACKEQASVLGITEADCENAAKDAEAEHYLAAPRYDEEALCEEDLEIEECVRVETADGGSSFMPLFVGYMLGRSSSSTGSSYVGRPYYVSKSGNYFTPTGENFGKMKSNQSSWAKTYNSMSKPAKLAPAPVMSRATVSSRGGFSARASSFGG